MDNLMLEHLKGTVGLYIKKLLITEDQMQIWYSDIERMASDSIVDKYAANLTKDKDSLLEGHSVQFEHVVTLKGINGQFIHINNTTVLDKTRAMLQKEEAVLTTIHEGVHFGQARVMDRLPDMTQTEHWCLNCANNEEQRNVFGIATEKSTYIRSQDPDHESNQLRACHYKLQFVERQAREITIEIGKAVGLNVSQKEEELRWATDKMKALYSCQNMDNKTFYEVIDNAQMKLIRQLPPENSLEASMMYDMAALMHEQELYVHKNALAGMLHRVQSEHFMDPKTKADTLAKAGFNHVNIIPFKAAHNMSIEDVAAIPQSIRDQSPLFMLHAIHECGEEIAPYINPEAFDAWYFAHIDKFDSDVRWEVGDALGDKKYEFGLENPPQLSPDDLAHLKIDNGELLNVDPRAVYDAEFNEFGDLLREVVTQDEAIEIIDDDPEIQIPEQ